MKSLEQIRAEYLQLYDQNLEPELGPYFRLLYNIIRHIKNSDLESDQKMNYARIARAYLSSAEIKLLMFNCVTRLGEEFKPWVEEFALLKHLHPQDHAENPQVFAAYSPAAFAGREFP